LLYYKRKLIILLALVFSILALFTSTIESAQRELVELGYTYDKAREKVNIQNAFNIVYETKTELQEAIHSQFDKAVTIGIDTSILDELNQEELSLVETYEYINLLIYNRVNYLDGAVSEMVAFLNEHEIAFDSELELYEKYRVYSDLVSEKQGELIQYYVNQLDRIAYRNFELVEDNATSLENVRAAYASQQERIASLNGFQNESLQRQARRMFNLINEYRAGLGLRPFTYNYAMQSCVFLEAQTYANTRNPHPWVCQPVSNANASLASVHSDYVAIAMNFFRTSPTHEAVISGPYSSATIAFVQQGGMVYMILYVFR